MGINIKKNPVAESLVKKAQAMKATLPVAVVSTEHKSGAETHLTETPFVPIQTQGTPALVEVSIGLTRNLGNFESVRLHVGLTLPCNPSEEEINSAYEEAKGWVDTRIEALSADIDKELGK